MEIRVRELVFDDLEMFYRHERKLFMESGRDGDVIFSPMESPREMSLENFVENKKKSLTKKTHECQWEKIWVITDDIEIYGNVILKHLLGIETTLHRSLMMMGIERKCRGKGFGKDLLKTAIDWAKRDPKVEYISLNVFSHNKAAMALYKKLGFEKIGVDRDLFRVFGKSVDDVNMVLKLDS